MQTRVFKDLDFPKAKLLESIQEFCDRNDYSYCQHQDSTDVKQIFLVTCRGMKDARLEVFNKNDGTTSFNYRTGQNQDVSFKLADHLSTKVPAEKGTSTVVLVGYTVDDIESAIQLMTEKKHESGESFFSYSKQVSDTQTRFEIVNKFYKDKLHVTVFITKTVNIQGRRLSCYEEFAFQMTDLLNTADLAKVISKTDETSIQLLEPQMLIKQLEKSLDPIYKHLPNSIQKLLLSSITLKSIRVSLPDYSCLVYPDLRCIEGAIKNILYCFDDIEYKELGDLFEYKKCTGHVLKQDIVEIINKEALVKELNKAYSFYCNHRHSLFHMAEIVDASRLVSNLDKAIDLTD